MIKTRIDKLLDTLKDTKDPDPEWSGAAYDYFKSQKEDLEKDLEVLDILLRKKVDIDGLIYIIKYNASSDFDLYNSLVPYGNALTQKDFDLYNSLVPHGNALTQEEFDKLVDWLKRNEII